MGERHGRSGWPGPRRAQEDHRGGDCSFETILRRYDLTDPVLWRIAAIVYEADLDDERYDAPEPGPEYGPARVGDELRR